MHVLGFGSLWNYGSHHLVNGDQYIGLAGVSAYQQATGNPLASFIPVETDGGSGTAGAHWDELALTNELMTGYINTDGNAAAGRPRLSNRRLPGLSLRRHAYRVHAAAYRVIAERRRRKLREPA